MRNKNGKIVRNNTEKGGVENRLFLTKDELLLCLFSGILGIGVILLSGHLVSVWKDARGLEAQQKNLREIKTNSLQEEAVYADEFFDENGMLSEYSKLYKMNNDIIGWLKIEDTVVDYPVMQTPEDEQYYLYRDFYKEKNRNGSLLMDTDSTVGIGNKKNGYQKMPSTNLLIHGHTMKSGAMFGDLEEYRNKEYGQLHSKIYFDSLYEKREYELIAVFYSQVYDKEVDVFKYYHFFNAKMQEEFDDWYGNIKEISLYDTGVEATMGDEFITLSCCAYQSKDRRFVVVAKRIK